MSNPSVAVRPEPSTRSSRRAVRRKSIRRRVVRLVLIPGIVAVLLWLVASGYLVVTGFYDREVANTVRKVSIPAVTALSSIQQERQLSIAYLADPAIGMTSLDQQRKTTDTELATLRTVANSALSLAPASIKTRWNALTDELDQMSGIRATIDSGTADRQRVYDFYNGVLNTATDLFDTQARVVPDVTATQGGLAGIEVFRASDLMSRAGSVVTGAYATRVFSRADYLQFVSLVGSYHSYLTDVLPHLQPEVQQQYKAMAASADWKSLVAAENTLIVSGPWSGTVPRALNVSPVGWQMLTTAVSHDLINMTVAQADQVSAQALHTGNKQLLIALLGSLIALGIAVGAIVWAVRQSQVLVDNALTVRLGQLGNDAAEVVDKRLPEMMARLRRRERVDSTIELPDRDYGSDEIGQLAEVLNKSLQVAVGAAVDEASTRQAGTVMLMGVARRPQSPLQHGLQVIEDLQGRIGDERLLADLFDVNHQLAQTRRFLENLIILAGGQTGRRFHKPVAARRVLLAATSETQQYQRISIRHAADVSLVGSAVAGTTHLLAELLDNALTFSPPASTVWVSCTQAARGVVVEIEDAGLGMLPDAIDAANHLLATAPTPDVTSLGDGSQVGLWVVAELAKRGGIQVTLRTSAYGGLLAIVLLPDRLIAADTDDLTAEVTAAAMTTGQLPIRRAAMPELAMSTTGDGRYGQHHLEARETPAETGDTSWTVPDIYERWTARTAEATTSASLDALPAQRTGEPDLSAPWSAAGPPPVVDDTSQAAKPPLPERRPQQHLVPELRDSATPEWEAAEPVRSAEEARDRFRRYQRGWRAGRDQESGEASRTTDHDRNA
ncbi:MAG TPA: nitrate- and nitrite sensing domain-containing protein [Micromonosporaceae bacterium]